MNPALLLVAKAPVAGLAKTRLTPPATPVEAARIAAAALLDTLDLLAAVPARRTVIALAGGLPDAERSAEIEAALRPTTVIPQRGATFADRLASAHRDAGGPVLQIGMDTPQLSPGLLIDAGRRLRGVDAVLGPATDGGWWALGLEDASHAEALREVPMSTADTCEQTAAVLRRRGLTVAMLPVQSDVDTFEDARAVAGLVPGSRFAAAVRELDRARAR